MTASDGPYDANDSAEAQDPSWSGERAAQFQGILAAMNAVARHVQQVAGLPSGGSPKQIVESIPGKLVRELSADAGWAMIRPRGQETYSLLSDSVEIVDDATMDARDAVPTEELESLGSREGDQTQLVGPDAAAKLVSSEASGACQAVVHYGDFAGTAFALVFVARRLSDGRYPFTSFHRAAVANVGEMLEASSRIASRIAEKMAEERFADRELQVARSGISRTAVLKACRRVLRLWYESLPAGDNEPPELPDHLDDVCAELIDRWRETLALPGLRRRQTGIPLSERAGSLWQAVKFAPPGAPTARFRIDVGPESTTEGDASESKRWVVVPEERELSWQALRRAFLWLEAALVYTGRADSECIGNWVDRGRGLLFPEDEDAPPAAPPGEE